MHKLLTILFLAIGVLTAQAEVKINNIWFRDRTIPGTYLYAQVRCVLGVLCLEVDRPAGGAGAHRGRCLLGMCSPGVGDDA